MSCLFAWLVLKSQINPSAVSLLATYVFKYDSVFSPQTADNETWIYCAYLRGRRTYSYAINTDVLKQRLHLICGTKHTQEQRYTTDPWSGQRDNMSLLMCLHFSLRVKLNFSVFFVCFSGKLPQPRPDYQHSEPDGCSSSLVGFQVNSAVGGLIAPAAQNYINKII